MNDPEKPPPAQGGPIPRGMEVLIKKASVDPAFKATLLESRAGAAAEIGLALEPSEAAMLDAVPATQLEAIIAQTSVPQGHRRAFLGKAAAAMLAALSVSGPELTDAGIGGSKIGSGTGIRPGPVPVQPPAAVEYRPGTIGYRVIAVVAEQLDVPAQRISRATTFVKDLQADAGRREAIRTGLEKQFDVTMGAEAFQKLQTVGETVDFVETKSTFEPQIVELIAKQLGADQKRIVREASLVGDLQIDAAKRVRIKRELESKYRVYISWDAFKKHKTVGEVVDHVAAAAGKRRAAAASTEKPVPPSPFWGGIRPNRPTILGIRPVR